MKIHLYEVTPATITRGLETPLQDNTVQIMDLIENEKRILAFMHRHGKTSKMVLTSKDGVDCAWATVSKLVNRLEKNGYLEKIGTDGISRRYGKNAYLYNLTQNSHLVLGIDVEKTITSAQILNLSGKALHHFECSTPILLNFAHLLEFLTDIIHRIFTEMAAQKDLFLGIGIGMPAQAPWHEQDCYANLAHELESKFSLSTKVSNNIHAYTDYYNLTHNEPDFYLIAVRTGVGAGFVVNHRLYKGMNYAGEVGHLQTNVDSSPANQMNIYENALSFPALQKWYHNQFGLDCPAPSHWNKLSKNHDAKLLKLLEHFSTQLSPLIETLVKVLDVPKIIIATAWNIDAEIMLNFICKSHPHWRERLLFEHFTKDQFVAASAFLIQKPYLL